MFTFSRSVVLMSVTGEKYRITKTPLVHDDQQEL